MSLLLDLSDEVHLSRGQRVDRVPGHLNLVGARSRTAVALLSEGLLDEAEQHLVSARDHLNRAITVIRRRGGQ